MQNLFFKILGKSLQKIKHAMVALHYFLVSMLHVTYYLLTCFTKRICLQPTIFVKKYVLQKFKNVLPTKAVLCLVESRSFHSGVRMRLQHFIKAKNPFRFSCTEFNGILTILGFTYMYKGFIN